METQQINNFKNSTLQFGNAPVVATFVEDDYTAEEFKLSMYPNRSKQLPFIIAETKDVTLKVETWYGTIITWNFTRGPYPLYLRRIIADPANTVTSCQILY